MQNGSASAEIGDRQYKLFMLRLWRDSAESDWRIIIQHADNPR